MNKLIILIRLILSSKATVITSDGYNYIVQSFGMTEEEEYDILHNDNWKEIQ